MPRGLLWQILASLECNEMECNVMKWNGMESNKKVLVFIGFIAQASASEYYPRAGRSSSTSAF
jgi:hypothetical protein